MVENENKEAEGKENAGTNADGSADPPANSGKKVNPFSIGVILLGLYLFILLLSGLYVLSSLMMAVTGEEAAREITKIEAAKEQPVDSNQSNTNAENIGNSNDATASNVESNTNAEGVVNANSNSSVNSDSNVAAANIAPAQNINSDTSVAETKPERPATTVPKQLVVRVFNQSYSISGDGYLFLVVLLAGLVGAAIRCVWSFFRHVGIGDFDTRWVWYYLMLPFGGAALSLVIYFVIRGGFYSSSLGRELTLNLYSFAALGTLTGLFSENAMAKLKEVSESLLTRAPGRGDRNKNGDADE